MVFVFRIGWCKAKGARYKGTVLVQWGLIGHKIGFKIGNVRKLSVHCVTQDNVAALESKVTNLHKTAKDVLLYIYTEND